MTRLVCAHPDGYASEAVEALCGALKIEPLTARALIRRGLTEPEAAARFIRPEREPLADPLDMHGMRAAVRRIRR
ncbi:MAG: hypothetical protein Q4C13_04015, partial [Clostridia bacterium]|nr:hypothetical protein [Clostridia bacterium]